MIPEYDVVVIDEAHELTARVTQAATDELWAAEVERAARRSQRHVEGDQADDLADAADALRAAIDEASPGRIDADPASSWPTRWCWSATPPGPASRRTPRTAGRRGRRPDPGQGRRAGGLRDRRADGRRPRVRRALDDRGHRADAAAALRRAAPGLGPDARQAAHRQDGRLHLGDADARRRLRVGGDQRRAQADRAGPRGPAGPTGRRRDAVARPRRRQPVRLRPAGDPVRRQAPAAARAATA